MCLEPPFIVFGASKPFYMLSFLISFHPADAVGLFPCFAPTGKILVHQGVEAGVMTGLQQMAEFVDDDVLGAPVGQE